MKSELLMRSPLLALPLLAFFLFLVVFLTVVFVTMSRKARAYEDIARLPIEGDNKGDNDDEQS
jgi:cbb3-type cytochrome oxidase subunit 3